MLKTIVIRDLSGSSCERQLSMITDIEQLTADYVGVNFPILLGDCFSGSLAVVECPSKMFVSQISSKKEIPGLVFSDLNKEEIEWAVSNVGLNRHRRLSSFFGGRIAFRKAIKTLRIDCNQKSSLTHSALLSHPILPSSTGAPTIHPSLIGSISHKDSLAVGLVALSSSQLNPRSACTLGVDIERCDSQAASHIAHRLLTQQEQGHLGAGSGLTAEQQTLLHFSLKEAVFKALHPLLQRPIAFHEAEIFLHSQAALEENNPFSRMHNRRPDNTLHLTGRANINLRIPETGFTADGRWTQLSHEAMRYFITAVEVKKS